MVPSTMATSRSSVHLSPPKNLFYKGGHANGVSSPAKRHGLGPTHGSNNRKVPKFKSGKPKPRHQPPCHRRQNDGHSKHNNVLLGRLSPPPASSLLSGTLLERIGGPAEDEVPSIPDRIDDERMSELAENYTDLPFSTTPHFYTPGPELGEVERFLESVIGAPPPRPSPSPPTSRPVHACLVCGSPRARHASFIYVTIKEGRPTLVLETHNLPVDHLVTVQDPSSSVLYSPTQTAVNSLSSANPTVDLYQQSPVLDGTMPPLTASAIEECRTYLVPVLLAAAQARDPAKHLDAEECRRLVSDDHCKDFIRQAKEMKLQLSSLVSQKTPVYQGWSGSLKRNRADDVDAWIRNTRTRLNSVNTVVSDASRRDSDITLVDFPGGRLPPKAPRAMLQASQATLAKSLKDAQEGAPNNALVASPTTEEPPASGTSLIELVHQAIKMFPTLAPTSQAKEEINVSNIPVGTSAGDPSGGQVAPPANAAPPGSVDFVSHLPTQPGIWFRQQGGHHAEIVDVDINVSNDMFYMSRESVPFRLRMYLRLCSVPVNTDNNSGDTPASLQDIDGVIERHALHWPKKGRLVVQVNPESERSKTWLPYTLESDPLDVTSCIQPGKNTFRFIQLSDLSEFTFVLAASPPLPEEEWRGWDWASAVVTRSSPTDDSTNGLAEFARVPVYVRS